LAGTTTGRLHSMRWEILVIKLVLTATLVSAGGMIWILFQ
jgi:hypothetical protein